MDSKVKTGLTHLGTATGGFLAAIAFLAQNKVDIYAIWNQLNVVIAAMTQFLALVTPLATAAYGIYRSTAGVRVAEIAADPKAIQVAKELPVTPETVALANALKKEPAL